MCSLYIQAENQWWKSYPWTAISILARSWGERGGVEVNRLPCDNQVCIVLLANSQPCRKEQSITSIPSKQA
jgi:hypothetical protein